MAIYSTLILHQQDDNLPHFNVKHIFFKNSFFPSTLIEWNTLDLNIFNSKSLRSIKGKILKFTCPSGNEVFLYNNLKGMQLLTRLRLGLSHL